MTAPVAAPGSGTDPSPRWARGFFWLCGSVAVLLLAARALHFLTHAYSPVVEAILGAGMQAGLRLLVLSVAIYPLQIAVGVMVGVLFVARRSICLRSRSGRYFLAPWLLSVAGFACVLNHYLIDLSPDIALVAALSMPVAFAGLSLRESRGARRALAVLSLGGAALAAATLDTGADRMATLAFWAGLLALARYVSPRLGRRERVLAVLVLSSAAQVLAAQLPLWFPSHGGVRIGGGYAYTFCEIPARHALYAAVPECEDAHQSCLAGHIAEVDTRDFTTVAKHRFFSNEFYGRLMHLVCLGDRVQVGMAQTMIEGQKLRENVLEFEAEHPERFRRSLFGGEMGQRIVHDAERNAVFYASEWSGNLLRLDRATGQLRRMTTDAPRAPAEGSWIFFGVVIDGSLVIEHQSLDGVRGRLFAAEWLTGSRVMEIDAVRLERLRTFDLHHGGSSSVVVDPGAERVYATGLFGLEVIDLRTGRLIRRVRLGFGGRLPVIDPLHGLVYVPTTAEGKLYILDREDLRVRHVLATGAGARSAALSHDGRHLFSTTSDAFYRWPTRELALLAGLGVAPVDAGHGQAHGSGADRATGNQ